MPVWLVQNDRIPVGTKIVRGNMTYWVAETKLEVPPSTLIRNANQREFNRHHGNSLLLVLEPEIPLWHMRLAGAQLPMPLKI